LIGCIGIDDDSIGYWLAEPMWGHGYITEAATALRDHHFTSGKADVLKSEYFVGNAASEKVLHKIGLRKVGECDAPCKALDTRVPAISMELTRTAWDSLRPAPQ
jgi:RimJ/RimL family protein N-acetyltransferase